MMNDFTGKKKTVMVVEDYKFTQDLIVSLLEGQGYVVIAKANNGKKALDLYQELSPDIVTMDMNMPGMNGLQTIQALLNIDSNARILAITGYKNIEPKALEVGAKGFLPKPFQPKQLYEAVEKILYSSYGLDETEMSQPTPAMVLTESEDESVQENESDMKHVVYDDTPSNDVSEVWGAFIPKAVQNDIELTKESDGSDETDESSAIIEPNAPVMILSDEDEEDDLLGPSRDFTQERVKRTEEPDVVEDFKETFTEDINPMNPITDSTDSQSSESNVAEKTKDIWDFSYESDIESDSEADGSDETDESSWVAVQNSEPASDTLEETKDETTTVSAECEEMDDNEIIVILNKPLNPQSQFIESHSSVSNNTGYARGFNESDALNDANEPLVIKPPKMLTTVNESNEAGTSKESETEINQTIPKKEKKRFSFFNIFKKNKKGKEVK